MWFSRMAETVRNADPMSTCRPWKPVAIKNVVPYAESEMEKGASMYSKACRAENRAPNDTVMVRANMDFLKFLFSISWWAQVTDTPEDKRRIVLMRGILIGLNEWMAKGGQAWPISGIGEILLCRNPQKNETKNRTSETINRIMPVFRPFMTMGEWFPCLRDSRWMSRHHTNATPNVIGRVIRMKDGVLSLNQFRADANRERAPPDARIGHGLTSTRWKGFRFFVII